MTSPRVILHVDMDAFYASVEQRDHPELRGRPVMVGGTGDRGVVTAASYEARRFGVHSAMPTAQARRLCPDGVFVRGSMRRYAAESRRIFQVFRRFTPVVEGLSLDEAFLDLSGSRRLLGAPAAVGQSLRRALRDETGLPASVGIAPVKMVAKIASALAKPDGLLEVEPNRVERFLDPLPVGRIWGVGPVAQARFERAGIRTIGELARMEGSRLEALLGEWGLGFARLARGRDLREVSAWREPVSYSEENTFARDVTQQGELEAAIVRHAESVARRLRRDGLRARSVVLKLKLARRRAPGPRGYPLLTRRTTLPEPVDDGAALERAARGLLARMPAQPVRLLGVGVTQLERSDAGQLSLFEASPQRRRRQRLNRALDEIAERFGANALVRGTPEAAERAGLSVQIKRGEDPPEPPSPSPSGRRASAERS